MKTRAREFLPLAGLVLLLLGLGSAGAASASTQATGTVFDDANGNGRLDRDEVGIAGVAISNGRDVVRADDHGRYRIAVGDDTILFVVKPSGWSTPMSEDGIPRFHYIHKPKGSPVDLAYPGVAPTGPLPDPLDFPLRRQFEPRRFDVILFGDTQPRNRGEIDLLGHDIIEDLIGTDAAFGITLGDVVHDDLSLFEPLNRAVGRIGVPWYNVLGNHDINYRSDGDAHSDETWERVYGPATYAFEYGPVHFIVLDNVVYKGANSAETFPYAGGLREDQLDFVRNYLALVPRNDLVVLAMHIPLARPDGLEMPIDFEVPQRRELFEILSGHSRTFSLSSHMHIQYHQFFGVDDGYDAPRPHHHLVHAAAAGSWWLGAPDEVGIPHATMRCGAPNGHSILSFDGNEYSVRFRAARRSADHQMHIIAPDVVPQAETGKTEVLVNVFAGSKLSTVEMRVGKDREWKRLELTAREDPHYVASYARDTAAADPEALQLLPPVPSLHLWVAKLPRRLPRRTHVIEVRTTDMFGREFVAHRLIRVE